MTFLNFSQLLKNVFPSKIKIIHFSEIKLNFSSTGKCFSLTSSFNDKQPKKIKKIIFHESCLFSWKWYSLADRQATRGSALVKSLVLWKLDFSWKGGFPLLYNIGSSALRKVQFPPFHINPMPGGCVNGEWSLSLF